MKAITLLGSTGSIGTQTLDIVEHHPDKFRIVGLAAGSNVEMLAQQVRQFRPEIVAIGNEAKLTEFKDAIADLDYRPIIVAGAQGTIEVAGYGDAQSVVTGIVGCAGLLPTIAAIKAGKLPSFEKLLSTTDDEIYGHGITSNYSQHSSFDRVKTYYASGQNFSSKPPGGT